MKNGGVRVIEIELNSIKVKKSNSKVTGFIQHSKKEDKFTKL